MGISNVGILSFRVYCADMQTRPQAVLFAVFISVNFAWRLEGVIEEKEAGWLPSDSNILVVSGLLGLLTLACIHSADYVLQSSKIAVRP